MPNNNSHGMLGARVVLAMALAAMLSACALAPGQHMITPPTLPDTTADVSPWNHWRMPAIVRDADTSAAP